MHTMKSPTFPEGTQFPIVIPWPSRLFTRIIGRNEMRYMLMGVTISDGTFYATDGRRILPHVHENDEAVRSLQGVCVTVPAELVKQIERNATKTNWPYVYLYEDRAEIEARNGMRLSTQYLTGDLPEFEIAINSAPKCENAVRAGLNAKLLLELAEAMAGQTAAVRWPSVQLELDPSNLEKPIRVTLASSNLIERPGQEVGYLMPIRKR